MFATAINTSPAGVLSEDSGAAVTGLLVKPGPLPETDNGVVPAMA